jgi:DNA uptake protein ComE-like DNA-binding protein
MRVLTAITILALALASGCSQQDTDKTRREAAQATEKIKEESKTAAVELKKDAKEVAKQTKAAVEGIREGLSTSDAPVNVNSASKTKLQTLPGVDEETADRIIRGRPYHTNDSLRKRGVVSLDEYKEIKDKVVVR